MSNLSRFKCKTGVLIKNSIINDHNLTKIILKKIKLQRVDYLSFGSIVYPSEISIQLKKENIFINDSLIDNCQENILEKLTYLNFINEKSKNYNSTENFNIRCNHSNFLFNSKVSYQKKQFRRIINNEMTHLFITDNQKFITFSLNEDIFLLDNVNYEYEIVKFYYKIQYIPCTSDLLKQINEYFYSYRLFFKKPSKNISSYVDIVEIFSKQKNLSINKQELNKYLKAEIFIQKSKNIENMYTELNEILEFLEKEKKFLKYIYKVNNRNIRICFKKLVTKNTIDPSTIDILDFMFYSKRDIDQVKDFIIYLIQHLKKFYIYPFVLK